MRRLFDSRRHAARFAAVVAVIALLVAGLAFDIRWALGALMGLAALGVCAGLVFFLWVMTSDSDFPLKRDRGPL